MTPNAPKLSLCSPNIHYCTLPRKLPKIGPTSLVSRLLTPTRLRGCVPNKFMKNRASYTLEIFKHFLFSFFLILVIITFIIFLIIYFIIFIFFIIFLIFFLSFFFIFLSFFLPVVQTFSKKWKITIFQVFFHFFNHFCFQWWNWWKW